MKKLKEYTGGNYIFMQIEFNNGIVEEISVYIRESGWIYKTTDRQKTREEIIQAFHDLY